MNFLKRALLSIQRRKGKSIILFLVIFILGNLMAGAIAIQQATRGVETDIKTQLGANATVSFNEDRIQEWKSLEKIWTSKSQIQMSIKKLVS
ncbi:hypothetical protein [Vagococcus teuberi]